MVICGLCKLYVETKTPNYIHNDNCGCDFHYTCYNQQLPNYFSITMPSCPNCYNYYKKDQLKHYENINYEESYNCWIGNTNKTKFICSEKMCFNRSHNKYFNMCEKHFYEYVPKFKLLDALSKVFKLCIGLNAEKKLKVFKELLLV